MAIKALIFDCFGVLVQPGRTLLYESFPESKDLINDLEHQWHYGMISREQFNESIAKLFNITPEEVKTRFYDVSVRDEKAIDWVKALKSDGTYKIGLLSNIGPNRLSEFFDSKEQAGLFDDIVLSFEVGMVKPEVMIFGLAAERLGLKPSECVMIDDNVTNVESANNAGMMGLRFISTEQAKYDLGIILEKENA